MPGRRGFLKALGVGAAAAGAAALPFVEKGVERTPEPPTLIGTTPMPETPTTFPENPFLSWGFRIRDQAGCSADCASVRYSEVEGIVAIRHEGFHGPLVKLEEDDWHGDVAGVREQTAIKLLARKHMIWNGDAPSSTHATGGYDWYAETDKYLDKIRFVNVSLENKLISWQQAIDMVLDETPLTLKSGYLPKGASK